MIHRLCCALLTASFISFNCVPSPAQPASASQPKGPVHATEPDCNCMWEGPVKFTGRELLQGKEALFIVGSVQWSPCCKPSTSAVRTWKITHDGVCKTVETLPSPKNQLSPVKGDWHIKLANGDTITLNSTAQAGVSSKQLKIGNLQTSSTESPKIIHLPVAPSSK